MYVPDPKNILKYVLYASLLILIIVIIIIVIIMFKKANDYKYNNAKEMSNLVYNKVYDLLSINRESCPHCLQLENNLTDVEFVRILKLGNKNEYPRNWRREKYTKNKQYKKSSIRHWGQRKLLLSEIEFLTKYGMDDCIVIYIGAAPGSHTYELTKMFHTIYPNMSYILIDPAPFNKKLTEISSLKEYERIEKKEPNITIINEYFTEELITDLKNNYINGKNILFISDIRRGDIQTDDNDTIEEDIKKDMELQKLGVITLNPEHSMLKFRLPWEKGTTNYLDGDIYLQTWAPVNSTETRLYISKNYNNEGTYFNMKNYDNTEYEELLCFYNRIARPSFYYHQCYDWKDTGYDYCYDCVSEVYIISCYLKKIGIISNENLLFEEGIENVNKNNNIINMVRNYNIEFNMILGGDMTLKSKNLDNKERYTMIKKKQNSTISRK